ncbi:hypothetical protein Tco_0852731 [Tanacetum coccineum]
MTQPGVQRKKGKRLETGLIMGVPEVMKISSFMDSIKSPELAKRFSSNIPKTVDEMMRRVDEFVRAEEAYARTELPPGESRDIHRRLSFPTRPRDVHQRLTFPLPQENDIDTEVAKEETTKGKLIIKTLNKCPKNFSYRNPTANCHSNQTSGKSVEDRRPQKVESLDEGPKAKSRKGTRQKPSPSTQGNQHGQNPPLTPKEKKKRRHREATEAWMNTPITFPGVISDDASDEPLIIEAEVEGYLVRHVYVDEGSSVEVDDFKQC